MSGIRIVKKSNYKFPKSCSSSLTVFIILIANISSVVYANAESTPFPETVNVYKCKSSKLPSGLKIVVPSYAFNSKVILRIKDDNPFPGCDSSQGILKDLQETDLANFAEEEPEFNDQEINDLESLYTTISPHGILNVKNRFYDKDDYCILDYTKPNDVTEIPSLKFQYCPQSCSNSEEEGSQLCIQKCCPPGKVVDFEEGYGYRCAFSGNKSWSGFFYDENSWTPISKYSEKQKFKKPHYFKKRMSKTCNGSNYEHWVMRKLVNETLSLTRLLTNGKLIHVSAHRSWKLLNTVKTRFCIDGIQNVGGPDSSPYYSGDERDQVVYICTEDFVEEPQKTLSSIYMYSLFGASFFYLATTIIYALIWDKHKTQGWTVFSLVLSQFFMCLFLGNAHLMGLHGDYETRNSALCVANGILAHFFTLASFTWLALINFDLWLKFRLIMVPNYTKNVDWKKLAIYSFIGWSAPLIVVIVGVVLGGLFPDRHSLVLVPEYGDSNCYVAAWAQGVYIYYNMAVLLGITVTLCFLTCINLYKAHKATATARSSSSAGDRKIFFMYARLSVVLGISWIFEFISWAASSEDHQHWIWVIFDMYNLLTAVFIFVIFVCNKITFDQLEEKYFSLCGHSRKSWDRTGTANSSITSSSTVVT